MENEYQRSYLPTRNVNCYDPFYISIFMQVLLFLSPCVFATVIIIFADTMILNIQITQILRMRNSKLSSELTSQDDLDKIEITNNEVAEDLKLSYILCTSGVSILYLIAVLNFGLMIYLYLKDDLQLKVYRREITTIKEEGELIGIIPNPNDEGKVQSIIPKREDDGPQAKFKYKIPYGFHGGKDKDKEEKKKKKHKKHKH